MTQIYNAAPMTIFNGIKDSSARPNPIALAIRPQHMPLFYIKSASGPVGRTIFNPNAISASNFFGAETFDVTGKYFNHQTVFMQGVLGEGNQVVVHRVVAADATDVANVTLYLDVLKTKVPVYKKEIDGSIVYDTSGEPVTEKGTDGKDKLVDGFEVMWVTEGKEHAIGDYQIGASTVRAGIQTGAEGASKQYPIFEFSWKDIGEDGNNYAVSLSALTERDRGLFPSATLTEAKMYPYLFSLNKMVNKVTGKTDIVYNSLGSESTVFAATDFGREPRTNDILGLERKMNRLYIKPKEPNAIPSGLGASHFYKSNYDQLVKDFYEAEANAVDEFSDTVIDKEQDNYNVINILSFVNSNNSPYQALKLVDSEESTRLTRNSKVFLETGDDGNLSDEEYEAYIRADMARYGNPLIPYTSFDMHPETDFYDTGFTLETKLACLNFISLRKDNFVILSTHIDGEKLSLEDELAIGTALDTATSLYPESTVYGTESCRALIYAASGEMATGDYERTIPFTYGLAIKAAKLMGAGDGKWVPGELFDKAIEGKSVVEELINVNIQWVPTSVRNTLWDNNINFPLKYSERHCYMPGIKTVFSDDTSVLTSYFNVKAACDLERVGYESWKQYSGNIELTDEQLIDRVNRYIAEETKGKYLDIYRIVPETKVTGRDEVRGFSWTTIIHLYANNMKTVMSLTIETHRFADYQAA